MSDTPAGEKEKPTYRNHSGHAVSEAVPFRVAEAEHQDYLQRYPDGYTCHFPGPGWKLPHRETARLCWPERRGGHRLTQLIPHPFRTGAREQPPQRSKIAVSRCFGEPPPSPE